MKNKKKKELTQVLKKTIEIVATAQTHDEMAHKIRSLSRRERRLLLRAEKDRKPTTSSEN
jgi:hypothetical protein